MHVQDLFIAWGVCGVGTVGGLGGKDWLLMTPSWDWAHGKGKTLTCSHVMGLRQHLGSFEPLMELGSLEPFFSSWASF